MSFWDVVWFIFISFAFAAYLMVIFSIIGDIFRDRTMAGWGKAVWVTALILVPLLTSLVYLIARGGDMADRSARAAAAHRAAQDAHIREVVGHATPTDHPTPTDQIAQARELLDSGAISRSEYDALKTKALVLLVGPPGVRPVSRSTRRRPRNHGRRWRAP